MDLEQQMAVYNDYTQETSIKLHLSLIPVRILNVFIPFQLGKMSAYIIEVVFPFDWSRA